MWLEGSEGGGVSLEAVKPFSSFLSSSSSSAFLPLRSRPHGWRGDSWFWDQYFISEFCGRNTRFLKLNNNYFSFKNRQIQIIYQFNFVIKKMSSVNILLIYFILLKKHFLYSYGS